MMKGGMRPVSLVLLTGLLGLTAASPPPSWQQAAVRDLTGMHDLIRDNHPGPVDVVNPGFSRWLDGGEVALLPQARQAASLHDYQLVIREYANGFADGHLGVTFKDTDRQTWPGFLVRTDGPDAALRVSVLETGQSAPVGVRMGSIVEECDGIPARTLLEDRVLRPRLNSHVPQRLRLASAWLMVADEDAPKDQWSSCVISQEGIRHAVSLRWRSITQAALATARIRSSGIDLPPTGLRHIGGVTLISIPSFYPQDADATARLQRLVADVKAQAKALHTARHVVLDLRGNDGGDDAWGREIARALWGKEAVDAVDATLSSTVDWRVSARNLSGIRDGAARMKADGHGDNAADFMRLADGMANALKRRQTFLREQGDTPAAAPKIVSPFSYPVYVLTSPHCASACLDFVDLLNGLPGVVRAGLETSSDTDYLDVAEAKLPSGHATLHYAMKVYRDRKRGANVSYKPTIPWVGGDMTDASIVDWIDTLH